MKYIGSGWQYRVYDLGNGRVLKIEQTPLRQFFVIGKDTIRRVYLWPPAIMRNVRSAIAITRHSREGLLERAYIPGYLLGNPEFFSDGSYSQDKVQLIEEILVGASESEVRAVFERYADLFLECWRYGFSDTIFNFMYNNGIDSGKRIVQIDIGELTFSLSKMDELIREKKWLKQNSYARRLSTAHQKIFREITEEKWTLKVLNTTWGMLVPSAR